MDENDVRHLREWRVSRGTNGHLASWPGENGRAPRPVACAEPGTRPNFSGWLKIADTGSGMVGYGLMSWIRPRLAPVAAGWLVFQLTLLLAVPTTLCSTISASTVGA